MSNSPAQILVIDDEIQNRKLLEVLLRADGYQTRSAANGEDALASVAAAPPDLILLDVMMPSPAPRAVRMPRCAVRPG